MSPNDVTGPEPNDTVPPEYVWKTGRAWAGTCRMFTLGIAAPTSPNLRFA